MYDIEIIVEEEVIRDILNATYEILPLKVVCNVIRGEECKLKNLTSALR